MVLLAFMNLPDEESSSGRLTPVNLRRNWWKVESPIQMLSSIF